MQSMQPVDRSHVVAPALETRAAPATKETIAQKKAEVKQAKLDLNLYRAGGRLDGKLGSDHKTFNAEVDNKLHEAYSKAAKELSVLKSNYANSMNSDKLAGKTSTFSTLGKLFTQFKECLGIRNEKRAEADPAAQARMAKNEAIAKAHAEILPKDRQDKMKEIHGLYGGKCAPQANRANLNAYVATEEFIKNCSTAEVIYNSGEMSSKDAVTLAKMRVPANIGGTTFCSNLEKLKEKAKSSLGAFFDEEVKNEQGKPFKEAPNSICILSETPFWRDPSKPDYLKVSVLSVPAPALDSITQPHHDYYVQNGKLNDEKYQKEMEHLANVIISQAVDKKPKRLLLSEFGQGAFLKALTDEDRIKANDMFVNAMTAAIAKQKDGLKGVEIAMYEYPGFPANEKRSNISIKLEASLKEKGVKLSIARGELPDVVKKGDLIVNAWDPHSVPGNGNDADKSFDGVLGKHSAIGMTQTPWMNPHLEADANYIPSAPAKASV